MTEMISADRKRVLLAEDMERRCARLLEQCKRAIARSKNLHCEVRVGRSVRQDDLDWVVARLAGWGWKAVADRDRRRRVVLKIEAQPPKSRVAGNFP